MRAHGLVDCTLYTLLSDSGYSAICMNDQGNSDLSFDIRFWSGTLFCSIWCDFALCVLPDDDLITIFDSSDLSFAIQCSRILKLTLFGKILNQHFVRELACWLPLVMLQLLLHHSITKGQSNAGLSTVTIQDLFIHYRKFCISNLIRQMTVELLRWVFCTSHTSS